MTAPTIRRARIPLSPHAFMLALLFAVPFSTSSQAQSSPSAVSRAPSDAETAYTEALRLYDQTNPEQPESYAPFKRQLAVAEAKGHHDARTILNALNSASDAASLARLLRPLADKGDVIAQTLVGSAYRMQPQPNSELAHRYLRAAAEKGLGAAEAQFELGLMYGLGEGVPDNEALGKRWIRRAAANGNPKAQRVAAEMDKDVAERKASTDRKNQNASDKCKNFAPSAQYVCQMMNGGAR